MERYEELMNGAVAERLIKLQGSVHNLMGLRDGKRQFEIQGVERESRNPSRGAPLE